MSKKIVVITGSPRKKGNSFAMTEVFIKAAEKKGHTVKRFDAAMMSVSGCHACETCFKTGKHNFFHGTLLPVKLFYPILCPITSPIARWRQYGSVYGASQKARKTITPAAPSSIEVAVLSLTSA